ncbi:MAG: hypothetical protein PHP52_05085 [Bacteroidales bacterium]|jgi:hypothetical protein|nr:hypothetical protein [Bacteroidales bacterium]MDD4216344.1 hypothetical protein [Bacteroidales bacterium]MDY0140498.1 hypothetical protein [Bacteroidales bacterium]
MRTIYKELLELKAEGKELPPEITEKEFWCMGNVLILYEIKSVDRIIKKDYCKLYLQVIIARKTKRYSLDLFVSPSNFDNVKNKL